MKKNEAKILVLLDVLPNQYKYLEILSLKAKIDYVYLTRIVKGMIYKKWIKVHKYGNKKFIDLNNKSPLQQARDLLAEGEIKYLQKYLKNKGIK